MINATVLTLYPDVRDPDTREERPCIGCILAFAPENALTTKFMTNVKTLIPGQYGKAKSSTTSQDFEKAFPKD
jgi:hypothetical protein